MLNAAINYQTVPLGLFTSTKFGRYEIMSNEQVFNFIQSDRGMVPAAGYRKVLSIGSVGRGLFFSSRASLIVVVIDDGVWIVSSSLSKVQVGTLTSNVGDIFIDENDNNQIAITDLQNIYVYNYVLNTFTISTTSSGPLDFTPGYLNFQNGYMVAPNIGSISGASTWRLSSLNNATDWPAGKNNVGTFQTKPDQPVACLRFPSRGNLLCVIGKTVTEFWQNEATSYPFPYVRSSSVNIDYGCLNANTIAEGDGFLIWLGSNEKSGPVIMYSTGGDIKQVSNDGINFKLAQLNNPTNAYGILFKQDGHLLYILTFPDPRDNLTYVYDFNTQQFFTLTDENLDHHIAKQIVFANNTYYFISFRDGDLYEMSTNFTNYDYGNGNIKEIPRIIYTNTFQLSSNLPFTGNYLTFPIEMGNIEDEGRIDVAVSRDYGATYGNNFSIDIQPIGERINRAVKYGLGYGNNIGFRFRFNGLGRFVVTEGEFCYY